MISQIKRYQLSAIFIYSFFCNTLLADNRDYIFPYQSISHSNYGGGGLIMNPSARFHEEGTLAVRWTNFDPYIRGAIIAYPFDWFEASYQYTDINNALYSDIEAFSGDQTYKDKGFDLKFRVFKEREVMPNIALGIRDIAGTGVFSSEYIAFSKYIGNFDFTFGLGWGHLSDNGKYRNPLGKISNSMYSRGVMDSSTQGGEVSLDSFFTGNMGLFGGFEYFFPNFHGARLKIEYSGIDYDQEGFPTEDSFSFAFEDVRKSQSKFNIGFEYPLNEYFKIDASFVKGNTFNVGITVALPLANNNSIIKKKNNKPIKVENPAERKVVASKSDENLYALALKGLNERGIFLQAANKQDSRLEIIYAQNTFPSFALSAGRAVRVLDSISPENITEFKVSNINGNMGMHSVLIKREDFNKYKEKKYTKLLLNNSKIEPFINNEKSLAYNPKINFPVYFWSISPDIRSQIGGPDGFFFGDLRLKFQTETLFAKNISLLVNTSVGIYDNFDSLQENPDSVLPHVRTDVIPFLKESRKANISRMQLNYFYSPSTNIYTKLSAGIFEEMFGGIGGEFLYRPFYKNFAIGAELWRVQKRDFDMRFAFRDYKTTTGHINFYYNEPRSNILFKIRGGKFLAQDSGFNFDFSRRFQSGTLIGAFFSLTDISKEEFGEGSFDKGFYFQVPLNLFIDGYSKRNFPWGLRPLTRDGAASLIHGQSIWAVTGEAHHRSLTRSWREFYE